MEDRLSKAEIEAIILEALDSEKGKQALSDAVWEPIMSRMRYERMVRDGRQLLTVEELKQFLEKIKEEEERGRGH